MLWLYSNMAAYGTCGAGEPSREQCVALGGKASDLDRNGTLCRSEFYTVMSMLSVKLLERALVQTSFVVLCPALGSGLWALLRPFAPAVSACAPSLPPTLPSCALMMLLARARAL